MVKMQQDADKVSKVQQWGNEYKYVLSLTFIWSKIVIKQIVLSWKTDLFIKMFDNC